MKNDKKSFFEALRDSMGGDLMKRAKDKGEKAKKSRSRMLEKVKERMKKKQ